MWGAGRGGQLYVPDNGRSGRIDHERRSGLGLAAASDVLSSGKVNDHRLAIARELIIGGSVETAITGSIQDMGIIKRIN